MAKILVVEDNDLNREMLSRRLVKRGYELVYAGDGQEAVDKAAAMRPDLILMDMSLPVMDGWEATRRIRENAALAAVPIIALTAHAMSGDREKAIEAGCNDYEPKPVELPSLLEKIERLLAGAKE